MPLISSPIPGSRIPHYTQDEALHILQRTSSARNIKIRHLAADPLSAVGQDQPPRLISAVQLPHHDLITRS